MTIGRRTIIAAIAAAASLAGAGSAPAAQDSYISGSGTTRPDNGRANAFTIELAHPLAGTVSYTGATGTYNGRIRCSFATGNVATIVTKDAAANLLNRTMVKDNGSAGDKLINTMVDLATASPRTIARFSECVAPDAAALAAAKPLAGDAITINLSGGA